MNVLALESSAITASACVVSNKKVSAVQTQTTGHTHSETLLPMAKKVLESASLTVDDIDLFAVSAGPGSFTGVRIGISSIKGLAFGKNKPVASVSSLEALAYNLDGFDGIVCPVMDARRSQVYTAIFKNGERLSPDMLIKTDELCKMLENYNEKIYFVGDGFELATKEIKLHNIIPTPIALRNQSAVSVALVGLKNYEGGIDIKSDLDIAPIYLRASQAERERNERLKND